MCVMSTIPTLNPQLNMTNANSKSKTTLNSGSVGFPITVRSNRNQVSPFRADNQMLNNELNRINKDSRRDNFASMVNNLPQISKKTVPVKADNSLYNATASKKFKRKASVPSASVMATKRMTQSLGPTAALETEGSIIEVG